MYVKTAFWIEDVFKSFEDIFNSFNKDIFKSFEDIYKYDISIIDLRMSSIHLKNIFNEYDMNLSLLYLKISSNNLKIFVIHLKISLIHLKISSNKLNMLKWHSIPFTFCN